jgi:hypothetical protein
MRWRDKLVQLCDALTTQASGRLGPALDPKALSITFLTAIQGGLLLAKLQGSSRALATALDEIIRFIECNSQRPKPRPPCRHRNSGKR